MTEEAKSLEAKNLGNQALKDGKPQDAVKYFSAGLTYTPKNEVLFSNRSAAYAALHQWEKALEDANAAIEIKPDWSKAHSRKALALFNLNRAEDSLAAYKEAFRLDPKNTDLQKDIKMAEALVLASEMNVLGEEFLAKKNYRLATEHFKKATDLAPGSRLYWSNTAQIDCLCGRYEDAVKAAERVIALSPYWHKGYQRKGEALSSMGRYADALKFFAHAQAVAPDNDQVRRAFSSCQQEAFNQQRRKEYEDLKAKEAKEAAEKKTATAPTDGTPMQTDAAQPKQAEPNATDAQQPPKQ